MKKSCRLCRKQLPITAFKEKRDGNFQSACLGCLSLYHCEHGITKYRCNICRGIQCHYCGYGTVRPSVEDP